MPRDNRISLGFNDDEYKKLKQRANEAHLKLGDYVRWYLFSAELEFIKKFGTSAYPVSKPQPNQTIPIPFKAAPEVIERIRAGAPVYVDPYQQAKLDAQKTFSTSGGLGELHNQIILKANGGSVLKAIPKKELKELKKAREERKVYANKHIEEIKLKNIKAGFLDDKEPLIEEK